ncbi:MAG TPA: acylphosphatase [Candidatus Portnoybacteria bacterium]|nr:acylphosphatase [Candidatus Portnoybacteria bacterium]
MKKRLECFIFGRVQLVMFRDFTQRKAKSLGLVGTVKNLPDGSVFVVAEGEEEKLARLLEKLKKGSLLSRVDKLEEKWLPATGEFINFKIVF